MLIRIIADQIQMIHCVVLDNKYNWYLCTCIGKTTCIYSAFNLSDWFAEVYTYTFVWYILE